MQYILKNKDIDVLKFKVELEERTDSSLHFKGTQKISEVSIINEALIPISLMKLLKGRKTGDIEYFLEEWINNRKVPSGRAHGLDILKACDAEHSRHFMNYVDRTFALSLNDSYWIVPADKDYKWKDYNLYDNEFDPIMQLVAFNGKEYKVIDCVLSPEVTTNGMLQKCWNRKDNQVYLYKGSRKEIYANGGKDAYSEYYCAQVASVLGFEAVTYDLLEFQEQIVCSCPLFTNENEGYLAIWDCIFEEKLDSKGDTSEQQIAELYGIEKFEDLMVFDAIVGNQDRHLGNFGMIIDNNTNKILRAAPIFDNGASFLNTFTKQDFKNYPDCEMDYQTYFRYVPIDQLEKYIRPRHMTGLRKLETFTFIRHEQYNVCEDWLVPFEKLIQHRANHAIQILTHKE